MAEGTDNISEKIEEDFLQCKVCFEVYRTPRTLPCLHSFCEACLELMLDGQTGTVTCPECRAVSDLQGNVRNAKASFFINSLLDLLRSKTAEKTAACSVCRSSAAPASSRCLDCAVLLCLPCARSHGLSEPTRGHRAVSLENRDAGRCDEEEARRRKEEEASEEAGAPPGTAMKRRPREGKKRRHGRTIRGPGGSRSAPGRCDEEEARRKQEHLCPEHQEPLRFYRSTCSATVCRDCRMLDHFSHEVLSLARAAATRRPRIEELIGSLDGDVRSLSQRKEEVDSALQQLKVAETDIIDKLSGHIAVMTKQLFTQRDDICGQLSDFVKRQEQEYLSIKSELSDQVNLAQNTKDFSSQVLQKGEDYEILDLERTVQGQIERLKKVSIPVIERNSPSLVIKEDIDVSRGVFQLMFEAQSDSQKSPHVCGAGVEQEPRTTSPKTVETCPQIPIAPRAQAAQSAPRASTPPKIPIAPRAQGPQSTPPTSTPSPSSHGNQHGNIPSSLLFIRSFDTDDDDSPNYENITGLALCPIRDIIIADNSNLKIKRIARNGRTRETIVPDDRGWNDVDPFSVAVCDENIFFTSGSILFKVPGNDCDDIVQVCNLRGSHQEYCIAAYEDEYIAVSEGVSCSLSLYTPSGGLLERINPDYEGKFVFLAVNRMEEFIVSDPVKKCVIILSRDGLILNICSTGSHSFYPRSVCVDKWNNIYVVEGKKILLFSPGGDFVRPLLTTSAYTPKLIAADERGHLVMVNKKGKVCIYRAVL